MRRRTVRALLPLVTPGWSFDLIRVTVTIAVVLTLIMIPVVGEAQRQIAAISPPGRVASAARLRANLARDDRGVHTSPIIMVDDSITSEHDYDYDYDFAFSAPYSLEVTYASPAP